MVAQIAVQPRVGVAPLSRRPAEERHIEHVGLGGVGDGRLCRRDFLRDEMRLNGVGMNSVIQLRERSVEIPCQRKTAVFLLLEALELVDQVELEFRAEPRTELEGDVGMGVGAAVTSGVGRQTYGTRAVNPCLGGKEKAVPPGFVSNSLEFEGIKIRVVKLFPDAEKQDLNLSKTADLLGNSQPNAQIDEQGLVSLGHDLARVVTVWPKLTPPLKAAILAIIGSAVPNSEEKV